MSRVGKTSIVNRLLDINPLTEYIPTIGYRYYNLDINEEDEQFYLQLWDVSGNEIYSSFLESYIKNAAFCVLIFDYNNLESQTKMVNLYPTINKYLKDSHIILVGNKAEKVKLEVPKKLKSWVEEKNQAIYPVSATKNTGVTLILQTILRVIKEDLSEEIQNSQAG